MLNKRVRQVKQYLNASVAAQKMLTPGGNILAELDMNLTEEQYQMLYSAPE